MHLSLFTTPVRQEQIFLVDGLAGSGFRGERRGNANPYFGTIRSHLPTFAVRGMPAHHNPWMVLG